MAGNVDLTASVHAPLVTRIREYGLDARLDHPLHGGEDDYVIWVSTDEAVVQITGAAECLHFSTPAGRWLVGLGDAPEAQDPARWFVYSGQDEDALVVAVLTALKRCAVCGTPEQVSPHGVGDAFAPVKAWGCPAHSKAVAAYVTA